MICFLNPEECKKKRETIVSMKMVQKQHEINKGTDLLRPFMCVCVCVCVCVCDQGPVLLHSTPIHCCAQQT